MANHFLTCPCGEKSRPFHRPGWEKISKDTGFHYAGEGVDTGLITTCAWLCPKCYGRAVHLATELFSVVQDPNISMPHLLKDSFVGWHCSACDKDFTFRDGNWERPGKKEGLPFFGSDGKELPGTFTLKLCLACVRKLGDPIKVESSCQHDCLKGYFAGIPGRVELKGTYPRD